MEKSPKMDNPFLITGYGKSTIYNNFSLECNDDLKRLKDIYEISLILVNSAIENDDLETGYESIMQLERRIRKFNNSKDKHMNNERFYYDGECDEPAIIDGNNGETYPTTDEGIFETVTELLNKQADTIERLKSERNYLKRMFNKIGVQKDD